MILIGLGANLATARFGSPKKTLQAVLGELGRRGVRVVKRSRWYASSAMPPSDQPPYVNAVAAVETELSPQALLELLHTIEREFGRRRTVANAAREIDLDLLAYGGLIRTQEPPILPHPRLAERAFVLQPLCDIDPAWRHPQLGRSAAELAASAGETTNVQLYENGEC